MKIYTKICWDLETLRVIHTESYEYSGPVDLVCGASKEERAAFQNEKKISDLLTENFERFAGQNTAILDNLSNTLTPIETGGPSAFGMSEAQESAERTFTAEEISSAGAQASNAVRGALAARGGGQVYLPSGSEAALLGSLAQDTAVKEAEAQSAITARGYDLGRSNWEFATDRLMRAPGELESPVTSAGGASVGAAGQEMTGATDITNAQNAWMAPVASIIGAAIPKIPGTGETSKPKTDGTNYGAGVG